MKTLLALIIAPSLLSQSPTVNELTPGSPRLFRAGNSFSQFLHPAENYGIHQERNGGVFSKVPKGVNFPTGKLSVIVLPDKTLDPGSRKMAVLLVNDTDVPQRVNVESESSANCRQEAKLGDGAWRPIEIGTLNIEMDDSRLRRKEPEIPPHGCFAFSAWRHQGPLKSRMRLRVDRYLVHSDHDLLSNEFWGSFHPGQVVKPDKQ